MPVRDVLDTEPYVDVPAGTKRAEKHGVVRRVLDWLGPSNAESIPMPLLVLAAISFLLLAAAAVSFGARKFQTRRMRPPGA